MPQVTASWSCADGKLAKLTLAQKDVLGGDTVWPIATEVLLADADGKTETVRADLKGRSGSVAGAAGKACPAYVFANDSDHAYGLFLMDDKSLEYVTSHIGAVPDLFERTLLWGAVWQTVTAAKFAPERYVELALKTLPGERDEALTASIVGRGTAAIHRYVGDATRARLMAQMQAMAKDRMVNDPNKDLRIVWFRALPGLSEQAAGRETLKGLLDGSLAVPGVALRQQDRWRLITALVAYGDADAQALSEMELRRDPSGDAGKYMYEAFAAKPNAETKAQYFRQYLTVYRDLPEDWVSDSLGAFNSWNQSALTAPYLKPAMEALAQIKQTRKIFFLVGWLNAFIGGQQSAEAQREVYAYLRTAEMDEDLRLKILQAVDELDKTVAVRKAYATR
jgi:aminopeptidase N